MKFQTITLSLLLGSCSTVTINPKCYDDAGGGGGGLGGTVEVLEPYPDLMDGAGWDLECAENTPAECQDKIKEAIRAQGGEIE